MICAAARNRLAFDEIFLLQLGMLRQKTAWQERHVRPFVAEDSWFSVQVNRLPFLLTAAQSHAFQDIQKDLASGHPMNRLIQGDVGSGKTIVAALAIALVTQHGPQAALMAPTSILAEQHYKTLLDVLSGDPDVGNTTPESTFSLQPDQIRLMIGATPRGRETRNPRRSRRRSH